MTARAAEDDARPDTAGAFTHPALFYRNEKEYLNGTVPFVRAGLAAGEPVAVAVPPARLALLRDAVPGTDVRWIDMTLAGRNPGRIIPGVLRAFADRQPPGRRVRIIGEPIWPGRSPAEYPACVQHEALINLAFAGRPVTILCPYDVDGLDPRAVADAAVTHPVIWDRDGERASGAYALAAGIAAGNLPLAEPPPDAVVLSFDEEGLPLVRDFARSHAGRLGLGPERAGDLELAVNELAANSVLHGGGAGTLRIWAADGHVVCEVSDGGHLSDPLVGRRPVALSTDGGRGVLLVNHIADLVRVHSTPDGTTIRCYLRR